MVKKPWDVVKDEIVLFGGGGNLIDGQYRTMFDTIERNISGNRRCIILPHTIFGYGSLAKYTKDNLVVFLRDPVSHTAFRKHDVEKANVHLAHDMTFYQPERTFMQFRKAGTGPFLCLRDDAEASSTAKDHRSIDLSLSWNGGWWGNEELSRFSTYALATVLSGYEAVFTDRLHIGILGAKLGKRVFLGANSYYKNETIYRHSLASSGNTVEFVPTRAGLIKRYDKYLATGQ